MNASKIFVQLLIGFLLIWCYVESTAGASTNMQKNKLKVYPCGWSMWCIEKSLGEASLTMQKDEFKGLGDLPTAGASTNMQIHEINGLEKCKFFACYYVLPRENLNKQKLELKGLGDLSTAGANTNMQIHELKGFEKCKFFACILVPQGASFNMLKQISVLAEIDTELPMTP